MIPIVEDLLQVNIFLLDMDFGDGALVGELARRSVGKQSNNVRLKRYKSHIVISLISMYASKLIAAHRVVLFS